MKVTRLIAKLISSGRTVVNIEGGATSGCDQKPLYRTTTIIIKQKQ